MDEKLNLQNLIALLAESHGMSKRNAESFVKEFFVLIEEALEKDKYVKIKGLGVFKLIEVDSRESVNVNTGERFEIQGHTKIAFTPDATLKDVINKPFSHFDTVVLNDDITLENTPLENGFADDSDDNDNVDNDADDIKEGGVETESESESSLPKESPANILKGETVGSDTVYAEHKNSDNDKELPSEQEPQSPEDMEVEPITPVERLSEVNNDKKAHYTFEDQDTEEDEETVEYDYAGSRDSSAVKYFISIVILIVLLCGGAIAFMYYPEITDDFISKPTPQNITKPVAKVPVQKPAQQDSLSENRDSAQNTVSEIASKSPIVKERAVIAHKPEVAPVAQNKTAASHVENNKVAHSEKNVNVQPSASDPSQYKIAGTKTTYTIQRDESLTKVSLHFYGSKALWPYIVKHNRDIIKDPDHVPYGTKIKIPELVQK